MAEVFRAFGLRLGALIWLLVGVWGIGLVAAPFAGLVARSAVTIETKPIEAGLELRRIEADLAAARRDWERATDPERRAELDRRIRLLTDRARWTMRQGSEPTVEPTVANYAELAGAPGRALLAGLGLALLTTALTLVVCWPVAWAAARASSRARVSLVLVAAVLPFALLEPLRLHAWNLVLPPTGLGGALGSPWSILPATIHSRAILVILPVFAALRGFDRRLIDTARDLGASHARIHARIVLPQAAPGLAVGAAATFLVDFGSLTVPWITARGRGDGGFTLLLWQRIAAAAEGPAAAFALTAAVVGLLGAALLLRLFGVRPCDFALRRCRS